VSQVAHRSACAQGLRGVGGLVETPVAWAKTALREPGYHLGRAAHWH